VARSQTCMVYQVLQVNFPTRPLSKIVLSKEQPKMVNSNYKIIGISGHIKFSLNCHMQPRNWIRYVVNGITRF